MKQTWPEDTPRFTRRFRRRTLRGRKLGAPKLLIIAERAKKKEGKGQHDRVFHPLCYFLRNDATAHLNGAKLPRVSHLME